MATRDGIDPTVNLVGLNLMARAFLNGTPKSDADASPVFADVRGLPPILIHIGEREVMLSDAIRLAGHLAENRVRVTLEVWPNMSMSGICSQLYCRRACRRSGELRNSWKRRWLATKVPTHEGVDTGVAVATPVSAISHLSA